MGYVNFPDKDEEGIVTSYLTGFEVFDNGSESRIKVAKDFISFIYENHEPKSRLKRGERRRIRT